MTVVRALLISAYDLGRQPFGLASAAAALGAAGIDVTCADLSRDRLREDDVRAAGAVGFFLPMHTATRLMIPVIDRVRTINPSARLCAFGLYAPLSAKLLCDHGVSITLGGEFEDALVAAVRHPEPRPVDAAVPRVTFRIPLRESLPPLTRYASLQVGPERRVTGYTEASRGCKHLCRHCPIVPVYGGRFRVVPLDVVLADVRAQVAAGAQHVTFGDPDFFNGVSHATAVLRAFGREFPGVSYDVTVKVEHLLQHRAVLPLLRDTGCVLITSAVEAIDDEVLARLEKGHTRADFEAVVDVCREAGLALAPTFVAFTPWTTVDGYCELLATIDRLGLVDHVAPIQLAIRLLVTEGSRLLELDDIQARLSRFDPASLTYPWTHADPRVDALQRDVAALVGVRLMTDRASAFDRIWTLAHEYAGRPAPPRQSDLLPRAAVPYLNEPWYC